MRLADIEVGGEYEISKQQIASTIRPWQNDIWPKSRVRVTEIVGGRITAEYLDGGWPREAGKRIFIGSRSLLRPWADRLAEEETARSVQELMADRKSEARARLSALVDELEAVGISTWAQNISGGGSLRHPSEFSCEIRLTEAQLRQIIAALTGAPPLTAPAADDSALAAIFS